MSNQYSELITDFLENCGEAEKAFVNETEWWIVNGSVKVQVFLTSLDEDAELIVAANILHLDKDSPTLNKYILQLNGSFKLKGASFGIRNQQLILSFVRPVEGLDPEELEWMIACIAILADEYDDFLIHKFQME
ncbi:MAG: YbjN domain-containing protein [SAR324 cluster bacterium]|nr:YbjN domain-containing protein [SAR324 cluster bacterium]